LTPSRDRITGNHTLIAGDLCPGYAKRAGVRHFGFHALRRHVASLLSNKYKVSGKLIQELLRHESFHTTERYLQRIHSDLKGALDLMDTLAAVDAKGEEK